MANPDQALAESERTARSGHDWIPTDLLSVSRFLERCREAGCDADLIARAVPELIAHYRTQKESRLAGELERRWYGSIELGEPDYGIYSDDLYVADLWACWQLYSRRYLADLVKPTAMEQGSVLDHIGPVSTVVDLGCGIGYSTAVLSLLYPNADVVGTNLPELSQTRIAESVGNEYSFSVSTTLPLFGELVFASEYFEHFQRPVDHLVEVLDALSPRALIVANTFGARSPGHFDVYGVGDQFVVGQVASRLFGKALREAGYVKVQTRLWNARPAYWLKTDG